MIYRLPDNTIINGQFEWNGINYPANWIQFATQAQLDHIGIITEPDPVPEPIPEPEPSIPERIEAVRAALQSEIDSKAHHFGFSSGNALMLYVGFPNQFRLLALQFATWEASVWVEAETYKAKVMQGLAPMLSPSEAVAMMPPYPA